jgi:hypothetical protein
MSESKVWSITCAVDGLEQLMPGKVLNDGAETKRKGGNQTFIEKFRLVFGFLMMLAGLFFGLFSTDIGVGLGFLTFLASPFVMITDK